MVDYIIKFEVRKNGQARMCLDGDTQDILAGVLTLIKSVHHQIFLNDDEPGATFFLEQIGKAMNCPEHPLYNEVREMEVHQ